MPQDPLGTALGALGVNLGESMPEVGYENYLSGVQLPPLLRHLLRQQLGGVRNRYGSAVSQLMQQPGIAMDQIPSWQDWLRNTFSGLGFLEELTPGVLSQGRQFGGVSRRRII